MALENVEAEVENILASFESMSFGKEKPTSQCRYTLIARSY